MTRFSVEEWFRGERVGKEATVASYSVGGSCDRGFDEGKRYMVYANRRSDGSWRVDVCSATATGTEQLRTLNTFETRWLIPAPALCGGMLSSTWTQPNMCDPDHPLHGHHLFWNQARVGSFPQPILKANIGSRVFPPANTL
jgi:hypothetical protein